MLPRRASRRSSHQSYSKVEESKESDEEYDDEQTCSPKRTRNQFCQWLYKYVESQTSLPSLILYAYLYWYLLIMISFGIKNMPTAAWIAGKAILKICLFFDIQYKQEQNINNTKSTKLQRLCWRHLCL